MGTISRYQSSEKKLNADEIFCDCVLNARQLVSDDTCDVPISCIAQENHWHFVDLFKYE